MTLTVVPVDLDGEVLTGADLAALIDDAVRRAGLRVVDGDVLAVASKVVAKAEGRYVDGDRDAAITAATVRVVAQRLTPTGLARIVRSTSGPVLAAAGVDASNLPPGAGVLLLPADPDASARALRAALRARWTAQIAVVVTDTLGRPWRIGQTDTALGAAGLVVAEDLAGTPDSHGRPLEVTVRALADEVAAASDLVRGKASGTPVALLRGLSALVTEDDGPGAAALLRGDAQDWFRYGHAEAARASIGVPPERVDLPPQPVLDGPARQRLTRAVAVALAAGEPGELRVDVDGADDSLRVTISGAADPGSWVAAGALAQRIRVAAWAEGLATPPTVVVAGT